MQINASYLEQKYSFPQGDDITLTFILRNEKGTIISNLSNYSIKFEISRSGDEVKLKNSNAGGDSSQISTSGSEIKVYIPNTNTTNFSRGYYNLELQVKVNSKIYTVFTDTIWITKEKLDW